MEITVLLRNDDPIMQFVGTLDMLWLHFSAAFFVIKGSIEVGDIQSFFQYIRNFTQPIQQIAQVTNLLQSSAAASERVFEFLDEEEEVQQPENPDSIEGLNGNVQFEHVEFGYNPDKIIIMIFLQMYRTDRNCHCRSDRSR